MVACVTAMMVSAGCITEAPDIDVSIVDVDSSTEEGVTSFQGSLTALDSYEGKFVVEDIRVEFVRANGSIIQSVAVGTLSSTSDSYNISAELERPPETVMIRTGTIKTKATVDIHHLRQNETGGWEYFREKG